MPLIGHDANGLLNSDGAIAFSSLRSGSLNIVEYIVVFKIFAQVNVSSNKVLETVFCRVSLLIVARIHLNKKWKKYVSFKINLTLNEVFDVASSRS